MTDERVAQFDRTGYTTVNAVLEPEAVSSLRARMKAAFDRPPGISETDLVRVEVPSRFPEIRATFRHHELIGLLREILGGKVILLPDMGAHDSGFPPWHKDTTSMQQRGSEFHRDPSFRMVHVGFYLQENGPYGGGLDVVPGSHRDSRDPFVRKPRTHVGQVLNYRVLEPLHTRRAVSVPTRAGDALIFDFGITHRATPPTACSREALPPEHRKFALFIACTGSHEIAAAYRNYLLRHEAYGFLEDQSYPEEFKRAVAEQDIVLA